MALASLRDQDGNEDPPAVGLSPVAQPVRLGVQVAGTAPGEIAAAPDRSHMRVQGRNGLLLRGLGIRLIRRSERAREGS